MKFNLQQRGKVADICLNIAQVSLASVVVPFFIDKSDLMMVALGLIISLLSWSGAMFVLRTR